MADPAPTVNVKASAKDWAPMPSPMSFAASGAPPDAAGDDEASEGPETCEISSDDLDKLQKDGQVTVDCEGEQLTLKLKDDSDASASDAGASSDEAAAPPGM